MSRIGKIPIKVPKIVKYSFNNGAALLEGPKGKLSMNLPLGISVEQKEDQLLVKRSSHTKQNKANHGTTRALLVNIINGITQGHKKELSIQGVGFKAQMQGSNLVLNVGLSHPVSYPIPQEVKISVPNPNSIIVESIDKAMVGLVASQIRGVKPPEPYKGKGIRYIDEVVRRKQGKSVTK